MCQNVWPANDVVLSKYQICSICGKRCIQINKVLAKYSTLGLGVHTGCRPVAKQCYPCNASIAHTTLSSGEWRNLQTSGQIFSSSFCSDIHRNDTGTVASLIRYARRARYAYCTYQFLLVLSYITRYSMLWLNCHLARTPIKLKNRYCRDICHVFGVNVIRLSMATTVCGSLMPSLCNCAMYCKVNQYISRAVCVIRRRYGQPCSHRPSFVRSGYV